MVDAPDQPTRVARLNVMLGTYTAHPRITDHTGSGWHIPFREDRCSLARRVAVIVTAGTAFHRVGRSMHRLGRCRSPSRDLVYAGKSLRPTDSKIP